MQVGHVGDNNRMRRTRPLPALNQSRTSSTPCRCGSAAGAAIGRTANTAANATSVQTRRSRASATLLMTLLRRSGGGRVERDLRAGAREVMIVGPVHGTVEHFQRVAARIRRVV